MKYSIIISPKNENSNAIEHAYRFIRALIVDSLESEAHNIHVFFYGYSVMTAFKQDDKWLEIANQKVELTACSTIAENYSQNPVSYFQIAGLGQWMDSTLSADKNIEFI